MIEKSSPQGIIGCVENITYDFNGEDVFINTAQKNRRCRLFVLKRYSVINIESE